VVILAKERSPGEGLEMLVRQSNANDGSLSLSLFEQIAGEQFLERSIRSNLPDRITSLAVEDLAHDGLYDLILATHDHATHRTSISLAHSDNRFNFPGVHAILSYPDSFSSTRSIIPALVNGDDREDLVITLGSPASSLGIVYGSGEGTFADSVEWISGAGPENDESLLIQDADGDGVVDITFLDEGADSVVVLYGKKNGGFSSPVPVCGAAGVSSVRIASLRFDGVRDLILSHGDRGSVSILFQPFRK
jgi:hypothetical protein